MEQSYLIARNLKARFVPHDLTPAQVDQLLRMAAAGLQWVTGQITIDEVQRQLGKPDDIWHTDGDSYSYMYSLGDFGGASFDWHPDMEKKGGQSMITRTLNITLGFDIISNIPHDIIERQLGLQNGKLVPGGTYYDPNRVEWYYELPVPDNSPFEASADFIYRIIPKDPTQSKPDATRNLQSVEIVRNYLFPWDLEERNFKKRKKYGYMNLRTDMSCPETGWWEGWTAAGPTDRAVVYKDAKFGKARSSLDPQQPDWSHFADAQWMWLKPENQLD